ncbi:general substrate transporter [Gigaspora margarita]|uniref:General substrate transporter n=1 Tax=Gigaspora margarita TaxID=4874 RepID=A0A8H3WWX0_GIGMA|nr:general substrate transporter [Gigaspora margarita]
MALSSTFTVLLISRFISGCGIGIGNMIATLYICEISPKFHRGVLVSCNMVLSNAALIISILTGILFESNGGGWRWMSAAASVIPLIQLFAVLFIPETPRFLVKKRDFEEARKVLSDIYPNSSNEFLDKEIEAIRSVIVEDTKGSYIDLIHYPNLKPTLIVTGVITLPEFCGFDTIMYYSTILLNMSGYSNVNDILKISLIVYGLNFIATVLGLLLVDRVGRRKLLLYTLFAAIIGLFLLGLAFVFITGFTTKQNTCSDYRNNCNGCLGDGRCVFSKQNGGICVLKNNLNLSDAYDSCPNNHLNVFVICSLAFSLMTYAAGFGNVPWLLQSELLPLNIRGRGVGVSTASNWVFTFVFAVLFLPLIGIITVSGTIWMFAIFTLLSWWFVFLFIPETAGRSLEEIEKLLAK